ncbi:T9SS type B sorting domain-containing protein [Polaribacter porphyrae]|uniref:Uncharacterized protein n=1 Tax=Polaribacter porphyrae TaxID=1137780 RepID=A0A2S7WM18_9FLAO|nr:T9SS type B sorting domain-containing protein [Polaribacter porphyrae]PQJ78506.1 hypothetical protein BTO18_04580 [Polaribacter porphyrae]
MVFYKSYSQLSKTHYIPPLTYAGFGNANPENQYFYISTPSTKNVNYTIKALGQPVSQNITGNVSNNNPQEIFIGTGNTQLFAPSSEAGKILTSNGYIIESDDVIYVSLRIQAGGSAQAGALVSKGSSALGTTFRAGMFTNENPQTNYLSFISVMATEDNTSITFSDLDNGILLKNYSGTLPINIILNEGESYIIAANSSESTINRDGLIGTLINSDKPIVTNLGSANGSFHNGGGRDYGIDQIVGLSKIGNEYIFVKGDGSNSWENVLIVAHEDNTSITLNGSVNFATINAGEYALIEGDEYNANGNLFVETSKPVFAYQGIGANNNEANQGLFFVPPLSCENRGNINNIPEIQNIGNINFSGGITIVANKGATINIQSETQTFTPSGPFNVDGNPNYVTYKLINLQGNISIESNQELYCAYFNQNGAASSGSFYSGFPSNPEINFNKTVTALGNCIPNVTLQAANTDLFDSIKWEFFNETTSTWEERSTNTNYKPISSEPGRYRLIGTITCTNTTFESVEIPVSICPDDFDGDFIIDNLDVDIDNDGILNCDESLGDANLDISNLNNPKIILADGAEKNIITAANLVSNNAINTFTGTNNGNFESVLSPTSANSKNTYTLDFSQNINFVLRQNNTGTHNNLDDEFFILKVGSNDKNITLLNPDNNLLVDTNFDNIFESGVTQISASEIRFKYSTNVSGTASTFEFLANQVSSITFEHASNGLTSASTFRGNFNITCFSLDSDGDGIENMFDLDSDNDGIPDIYDAYGSQITLTNSDANLDGLDDVFDSISTNLDTDNDNIKNYIDYDADNDGIFDSTESGHNLDTNFNGVIDGFIDINKNGLDDRLEDLNLIINYTIRDTDADDIFNFIDNDADNDNCFDVTEAGFTDVNTDGFLGDIPVQVDINGKVINTTNGYTIPNSEYTTSAPITITKFENTTFCELDTNTITIESTADNFEWATSIDGVTWNVITDNVIYSGTTSNTLQITNTPLSYNNYQYRVLLRRVGNACTTTSNSITLTVNPKPIILNSIIQLNQCADNPNEITTINLTEAEINISTDTSVTFEYYETETKAVAGGISNQVIDKLKYPVNRTAEAWVRTVSDKDCYTISKIEITATFVSDVAYDKTFEECDDFLDADGNNTILNSETDGITTFNFSSAAQEIKNLFPNPNDIEVFFYETIADRDGAINAIPDISRHRNNSDTSFAFNQTIFIKIKNKNNNDCEGLGKLFLKTSEVPQFTVKGESPNDPILVCSKNLPFSLMAENPKGDYRYIWEDENGNKLGENQDQLINGGGNYTVTAYTKNSTVCSKSRTISVKQSNPAILDESFVVITDEINISNSNNLSVTVNIPQDPLNPEEYLYSLETKNGQIVKFPQESNIFTNITGGVYKLIVENKNGCGISELLISVIQFPKFFTPNNDGENDTWSVKGVDALFYSESIMTIFNRYGKLIYKSSNQNLGWDGTYNGKQLNNGDYWYQIVLKPTDITKPMIDRKGNFSLLKE